jgi:hypothetical protein
LIHSSEREFLVSIYQNDRGERVRLDMSTTFSQRVGLSYSRFEFIKQEVGVSFETFA